MSETRVWSIAGMMVRRGCGWGGHWNAERETCPCPNASFLHQSSYMDLPGIRLRPLVRG